MGAFDQETYPAIPQSVARARAFVTNAFAGHPDQQDARLLVSELATNAVRHGEGGQFTITIESRPDAVRVWVSNPGDGRLPVRKRDRDLTSEDGRGIALVDECAWRWGYAQDNRETVVYFDFPAVLAVAS